MSASKIRCLLTIPGLVATLLLSSACEPPGEVSSREAETVTPMQFKALFQQSCSGCHGTDGRQGPARVLNDPLYLAVSSKENIRQILIHGRPGTLMPAWAKSHGGPLTDEQIGVLVNGMESDWAKPVNSSGAPLPSYDGAGLTGDPAHGKKLFARGCFACHAKGGVAGPVTDPNYLALSSNQNLRTSIIVGRPDFPGIQMPNYRSLNAGHALSDQDIADLVTYLSTMRPPNSKIAMSEVMNEQTKEISRKPGVKQ